MSADGIRISYHCNNYQNNNFLKQLGKNNAVIILMSDDELVKNVRDGGYSFKNIFVLQKYSVNLSLLSSSKNTHRKKDDDH